MSDWQQALPHPLWSLPRVTRDGRSFGSYSLTAQELERCAHDRQGLLVADTRLEAAAGLVEQFAARFMEGLLWVVVPGTYHRAALLERGPSGGHAPYAIHPGHPAYALPAHDWLEAGANTLISTFSELGSKGPDSPCHRPDVLDVFCPLLVLVDPELDVLQRSRVLDSSKAVRQAIGRIGAFQGLVSVAVLTTKAVKGFYPSDLQKTLTLDGFLFLSGRSRRGQLPRAGEPPPPPRKPPPTPEKLQQKAAQQRAAAAPANTRVTTPRRAVREPRSTPKRAPAGRVAPIKERLRLGRQPTPKPPPIPTKPAPVPPDLYRAIVTLVRQGEKPIARLLMGKLNRVLRRRVEVHHVLTALADEPFAAKLRALQAPQAAQTQSPSSLLFGRWLRRERETRGLTVERLAEQLWTSPIRLASLEAGDPPLQAERDAIERTFRKPSPPKPNLPPNADSDLANALTQLASEGHPLSDKFLAREISERLMLERKVLATEVRELLTSRSFRAHLDALHAESQPALRRL